ncbi:MAG TPA: thiol peroxidase [Thermoflexales bacterium]|nr:thiol peroxidase [Thermoflexales bacterium]HQW34462.1 thiol peroxidase [Thermoflexales bacterium]HRA00099.1 thiol peroxidase [Thermoflexales bacterium]
MTQATNPPAERRGVIEVGGKPATVIGNDVKVGEAAPAFIASANDWTPVDVLAASAGKVRILAAVPSLDTSVCARETRRFNEEAGKLDPNIVIYTISTDFPFRQKEWCGAQGIDRVHTVSDVVDGDFGVKYGTLIKERRFHRRAVFVVDPQGKLVYAAYMPKLGDEPHYEEVLAAAKAALG